MNKGRRAFVGLSCALIGLSVISGVCYGIAGKQATHSRKDGWQSPGHCTHLSEDDIRKYFPSVDIEALRKARKSGISRVRVSTVTFSHLDDGTDASLKQGQAH